MYGVYIEEPTFSKMEFKRNVIKFIPDEENVQQNLCSLNIKFLDNGTLKLLLNHNQKFLNKVL